MNAITEIEPEAPVVPVSQFVAFDGSQVGVHVMRGDDRIILTVGMAPVSASMHLTRAEAWAAGEALIRAAGRVTP